MKYIQEIDNDLWFIEDEHNFKISYRIKEIIFSEKSNFQHVMVLDSYDFGKMLVLDGAVQTTTVDGYIYNEIISHVPLNIHPDPKRVLIIGGGDCGVAREVAKYPNIEEIDMVEIDEMVVRVSKKYLPEVSGNLSDPRVNFIFDDGAKFAQERKNYYDVAIIDSSDPVGPAVPLFQSQFYENIYNSLKEDGIMVCQSESPFFYAEALRKSYNSIKKLFPITKLYTAIIPTYPGGLWCFTLGSKKHEKIMSDKFDKETKYVNKEILKSCFSLPNFVEKMLEL